MTRKHAGQEKQKQQKFIKSIYGIEAVNDLSPMTNAMMMMPMANPMTMMILRLRRRSQCRNCTTCDQRQKNSLEHKLSVSRPALLPPQPSRVEKHVTRESLLAPKGIFTS